MLWPALCCIARNCLIFDASNFTLSFSALVHDMHDILIRLVACLEMDAGIIIYALLDRHQGVSLSRDHRDSRNLLNWEACKHTKVSSMEQ